MFYNFRVTLFLVFVPLIVFGGISRDELEPATGKELKLIEKAIPRKSSVKPKKKRKIMVFWLTEGFVHDCILVANTAIEKMGKKSGAYEAVIEDSMDVFEAKNLSQYDAIIFNNTTRLKFKDKKHRKALMDYVKGGGGFIGIHSAADNFKDWKEAEEMIGGQFDGHPWGAGGTWAFLIDDIKHAINKTFGGKKFLLSDEIYQFKGDYAKDNTHVLVSLDMENKINYPKAKKPKNKKKKPKPGSATKHIPKKKYNPVSWVRSWGKGRVFYSAFGHRRDIFWNPTILKHYLDGFQYALGDLKAPDKP